MTTGPLPRRHAAGAETGPRFLSIRLPFLPVERVFRMRHAAGAPPETGPFATIAPVRGAMRLAGLDAAALAAGLRPGQGLAEARAMRPDLAVAEADPGAEAALIEAIADWARRWTPITALDGPAGVMLDITGAAHLFGGEAGLLADVEARLRTQGFSTRLAIAGTPDAARALAVCGKGGIHPSGEEADLLAPLPVAALAIAPATAESLVRLGLKRIGDLTGRPRAPLAARFGEALLVALDRALGRSRAPLSPRQPLPPYLAERRFAEPVADMETVTRSLDALCRATTDRLARHGEGARRLELTFYRTDGTVLAVEAGTSRPEREAATLASLLRQRLEARPEGIDAGFGFDLMRLAVLAAAPLGPRQIDLAAGPDAHEDLARLADRLGARFGLDRVLRLEPRDAHRPEAAQAQRPAVLSAPADSAGWALFEASEAPRPLTIFARPEPVEAVAEVPDGPPLRFRWRRVLHEVIRAEGPERIAPEWWTGEGSRGTRDYFRVEDRAGRRFWLFREGLFGIETAAPRWFVHGLFA